MEHASKHVSTIQDREPVTLRDTQQQDRVLEPQTFWVKHRRLAVVASAIAMATITLIAVLLQTGGADRSVSSARLTIATVERGSFVRDVATDGYVIAATNPTLYAPSAGNVTLNVRAGDTVQKDQVLAVIDSPDLKAKLSQEEVTRQSLELDWKRAKIEGEQKLAQVRAAFEQASIDQTTAQRESERSRKAFVIGAYSELQALRAEDAYEKARFAFRRARIDYEREPNQMRFEIDSRKALLDRQQYIVSDLQRQVQALGIRSPVEGKVGQVVVVDRANVPRDAPLLSVVDLSDLAVEIKVAQSLARDLTTGMSADIEGDGRVWKGVVDSVSPQVINGEVAARVRFAPEQPQGLRQNQRLSVRIFIDRRTDVLMVDRGSFLEQEGGGFAYLVRDGFADRRPVRLGAASVQKVEIVEGLVAGDQIVVSGTDAFQGAQRVILSD